MSPTRREREYAKRRYNKWQNKLAMRMDRRRRQRQIGLAAAGAVATVAVIAVVGTMLMGGDDSTTATAATPSASATAANNPCGQPPAKPSAPKSWSTPPSKDLAQGKTWTWTIETSCGPVRVELDGAKAPQAVSSTIFLSQQGFYDSVPCHRLTVQGIYVLQCGDPTGSGTGGPGFSYGPVENAPKNNVYPAGTVAIARQGGRGDSMGSQFFLVYKDSTIPSDNAGGYSVIGKISGGQDVVEKVAAGGLASGSDIAPARAVSILSTSVAPS
ncbi:MAG TPA: peptidylprolyl isomerase [Kineosporiaceae bacterium]|nr:peptidylprolyl isomerase [Kineosporiaceae bacterium]